MARGVFGLAVLALLAMAIMAEVAAAQGQGKPKAPPKPPKAPKPLKPVKPINVMCKNKLYPYCLHKKWACPAGCPRSCVADCNLCKPVCTCDKPGGVCHDPRFVGGDGITFFFHGRKDQDFCLVSDSDVHINGHFIGRRGANMTRDFTWVQSIGILFGHHHRLSVSALKTATWDDSSDRLEITLDGEPVDVPAGEGSAWRSPPLTIVRTSDANAVTVEADGQFKISVTVVPITAEESRVHRYGVTEEDCFAHLEMGFKFFALSSDVHGVLGQTYREDYMSRVKMSSDMPIMSGTHLYSSSGIFAADCAVSRFGRRGGGLALPSSLSEGYADMKCGSGISGGRGIVCKK